MKIKSQVLEIKRDSSLNKNMFLIKSLPESEIYNRYKITASAF